MSLTLINLIEDTFARQGFIKFVHDSLVSNLGDHKWLVRVFSEQEDPESFGTTDEQFNERFLCATDCVCFGEGGCDADDCECMFTTPQVGIRVQYNVKLGDVDHEAIEKIVVSASRRMDFEDTFPVIDIVPIGRKSNTDNTVTSDTDPVTGKLEALLGQGFSEEELIRRVLYTVRDSFPVKGSSRDGISQVARVWVKRP